MTTITNQTLTLTITSGSVDTVIRKDNCRIDVFGDYVRITDFNLDRYEFLYSEVDSPASASAEELSEALQEFLNTAGGGGGGVESVTGDLVDNSDPANPIVSIPQGEYTPVVTNLINLDDVSLISAWYIDFGDFVKVDLTFEITLSAGETQGEFNITFPDAGTPSATHLVCGTGLVSLRIDTIGLVQADVQTAGSSQKIEFTVTYKKA